MKLLLTGLFYIFSPYFILLLTKRYKILDKIGAVLLCYVLGFIAGVSGFLPKDSDTVQEIITSASIPLALPLLLFGSNFKQWVKLAGRTFISMLLAIIALIMVVTVSWILFGDRLPGSWQISGLLIGLYTGGTPNLASIQAALDISPEIYLMVNTYDIFVSAIFLLIIMSTGRKLFGKILPHYKAIEDNKENINYYEKMITDSYSGIFKANIFIKLLYALGAAIVIAGISAGLSFLITGEISMLIVILSITTLSLTASFIPNLNKAPKTFEAGMYLILVFSITVASMVNIDNIINISPALFWFVATVVFGTFILHVIFSAIFKSDTDTTLITATALICSPPFVPVVAGVLKNKQIILSGLTIGIIGYAIGNYLGVLIAVLLKGFT